MNELSREESQHEGEPTAGKTKEISADSSMATKSKYHALLIGVQDYSDVKNFNDLEGPRNDVELTRRMLIERFEVPAHNITTLIDGIAPGTTKGIDGPATHCRIRQAFLDLVNSLQSSDQLYIHYSGHGSQIPKAPQSPEKFSQTWVPWGARRGTHAPTEFCDSHDAAKNLNAYDVLDEEINGWLERLEQKGIEILWVSDSCHSATVTRDKAIGLRTGPPPTDIKDTSEHPAHVPNYHPRPHSPLTIYLGAAHDLDSAQEKSFEGKVYGYLSWYWAKSLSMTGPKTTWEDAFEQAAAQVRHATLGMQRPTIGGARKSAEIGTGKIPPPQITLTVDKLTTGSGKNNDTVTLNGGLLVGVNSGSTYRRRSLAGTDNSPQPSIEIQTADAFTSTGVIHDFSAAPGVQVGDRFVEESRVYRTDPIRLLVNADEAATAANPTLIAEIQNALKNIKGFELVRERGQHDIEAYAVRYSKRADGSYALNPADSRTLPLADPLGNTEIWILDRNQDLLYEGLKTPVGTSAAELTKALDIVQYNLITYAKKQQILSLAADVAMRPKNLDAEMFLEMRIRSPKLNGPSIPDDCDFTGREDQYALRTIQVRAFGTWRRITSQESTGESPAENPLPLQRDDCLSFAVTNKSASKAVYAYLLNLTPDAEIKYIFPYPADPESYALIEPQETRDYALPQWYRVWFKTSQSGIDTLMFLATEKPIDVSLFKLDGYQLRNNHGTSKNPLETLLEEAMYNRGDIIRAYPDRWSATEIQFEIPK